MNIKPRLGDRFFVESVLIDIFGPGSEAIVRKYVFMSVGTFGGPCDNYEQVRIGDKPEDFADPHSLCPGGKMATSVPMIANYNMLRHGFITRTCEILISQQKTRDYAFAKIFKIEKLENPNLKNLTMLFQLFNPEKIPSQEVIDSLAKIADHEIDLRKRWERIFLSICIDPQWQII